MDMMTNYISPFPFSNGHIDTLIPFIIRKKKLQPYERERLILEDNDFLDLDWVKQGSRELVILSHGLESNSSAKYILGMADMFRKNGFDIVAWNSRGCSGEDNLASHSYHSGMSQDLSSVIKHCLKLGYKKINLIGFSMGGNITLKYLGEMGNSVSELIHRVCVFSTPINLAHASSRLERGFSKVYTKRFLKTLFEKVKNKKRQFPELNIDIDNITKVTDLKTFDEYFTAPMFGFRNAQDYYSKVSSIKFLKDIQVPTLIVNALNDPFLAEECYPYDEARKNSSITLETPLAGGHCGFYEYNSEGVLWSERRALDFINSEEVIPC